MLKRTRSNGSGDPSHASSDKPNDAHTNKENLRAGDGTKKMRADPHQTESFRLSLSEAEIEAFISNIASADISFENLPASDHSSVEDSKDEIPTSVLSEIDLEHETSVSVIEISPEDSSLKELCNHHIAYCISMQKLLASLQSEGIYRTTLMNYSGLNDLNRGLLSALRRYREDSRTSQQNTIERWLTQDPSTIFINYLRNELLLATSALEKSVSFIINASSNNLPSDISKMHDDMTHILDQHEQSLAYLQDAKESIVNLARTRTPQAQAEIDTLYLRTNPHRVREFFHDLLEKFKSSRLQTNQNATQLLDFILVLFSHIEFQYQELETCFVEAKQAQNTNFNLTERLQGELQKFTHSWNNSRSVASTHLNAPVNNDDVIIANTVSLQALVEKIYYQHLTNREIVARLYFCSSNPNFRYTGLLDDRAYITELSRLLESCSNHIEKRQGPLSLYKEFAFAFFRIRDLVKTFIEDFQNLKQNPTNLMSLNLSDYRSIINFMTESISNACRKLHEELDASSQAEFIDMKRIDDLYKRNEIERIGTILNTFYSLFTRSQIRKNSLAANLMEFLLRSIALLEKQYLELCEKFQGSQLHQINYRSAKIRSLLDNWTDNKRLCECVVIPPDNISAGDSSSRSQNLSIIARPANVTAAPPVTPHITNATGRSSMRGMFGVRASNANGPFIPPRAIQEAQTTPRVTAPTTLKL